MHLVKFTESIDEIIAPGLIQWDSGRTLLIELPETPSKVEVHFAPYKLSKNALVVDATIEDGVVTAPIPNILLQTASESVAWVYAIDEASNKTIKTIYLPIEGRAKPTDYVYTETEVKRWDDLYKRLDELELGARAIIDVEELPTEDINTALLYRTADGVYWYDGEWHKVADESDIEKSIDEISREIEENILPHIVNADYEENNPENKSYIANRPFYDTRETDENGEEIGELVTLEDKYLDLENRAKMKEVESIAKGANQAVSFGNYETMITAFNNLPPDVYRVGQNVMIVTLNVPDLWIADVSPTYVNYNFTSNEGFVSTLNEMGYVQVGYYELSALETQKVDLTEYVKINDFGYGKLARTKAAHGMSQTADGYIYPSPPANSSIDNRNRYNWLNCESVDYVTKVGLTANNLTLTDEEKSSARAWLGAIGNTDYAGEGKAGVIKTSNGTGGCTVTGDGYLYFYGIQDGEWAVRGTSYAGSRHLRLSHVDNIVKYGVTDNKIALTDEEKASAQNWLGVKLYKHNVGLSGGDSVMYNNYASIYATFVSLSPNPISTLQELVESPAVSYGNLKFVNSSYSSFDAPEGQREVCSVVVNKTSIDVYYVTAYTVPITKSFSQYNENELTITDAVTEM